MHPSIPVALFASTVLLIGQPAGGQPAEQPSGQPDHRSAVFASAAEEHRAVRTIVDPDGATHVRYTRTYRGLRVHGGDYVVHRGPGREADEVSVGLTAPLTLSISPTMPATTASNAAVAAFDGSVTRAGTPELAVDASSGRGRLVWETVVSGLAVDGQTPSHLHVLTDAHSGELIRTWDEIHSSTMLPAGEGRTIYSGKVTIDTTRDSDGTFSMVDPGRGNGYTCDMRNGTTSCTTFTDADNVWGNYAQSNRQSAAADAHYGAAKTYDYFRYVHGRHGIFGDGRGVPSRVHYGNGYANAFWDGARMTYGDGANNARPLVALDVAGHEMAHGITSNVVPGGLVYSGESGGLNEATSDIFGTMVEFYADNPSDPGDYLIGEKIDIYGNGKPLRYMYNPGLDGRSHTCWSTSTGGVDVHYSSGVGNHFFFNLAQGTGSTPYGTSPVCGSAPGMTGIGRAKAEKIWYRALDVYFTSTTSYVNAANPGNTARAYTLRAAADLYGHCGTEYKAVQAAWRAVNVSGSDAACPTPLSVYISGPGGIQVKGTYTYRAVYSGFNPNPTFTWSERFCTGYSESSCGSWRTITGLGSTFNRVLGPDCTPQESNFQLKVVVRNSDGRTATDTHRTGLCGEPL